MKREERNNYDLLLCLSLSLSVYLWTQAFTLVALLERLCTLFYPQYVSTCGFTHPCCEVVYTRRDDDE